MKAIYKKVLFCRDWNTRKFYIYKDMWVVYDEKQLQYLGMEVIKYYFYNKEDAINFIEDEL